MVDCDRGEKTHQWRKTVLFHKWCWNNGDICIQKETYPKPNHTLYHIQKLTQSDGESKCTSKSKTSG